MWVAGAHQDSQLSCGLGKDRQANLAEWSIWWGLAAALTHPSNSSHFGVAMSTHAVQPPLRQEINSAICRLRASQPGLPIPGHRVAPQRYVMH